MKLSLRLRLLQLLAISLPCIAIASTQLVYDTEGKELSSEFDYYVVPAKRGIGGGLIAIPTGLRCLHFVVQERNETRPGTAVVFTPRNASAGEAIHLSSDVWIEFNDLESFCVDRLDWHLTDKLPESLSGRHQHVAAGNEDGIRSSGVFRVERHDANMMGYKIVSCANKGPCKDLGLLAYKDKTWLTISDDPFIVVFRKA